MSLHEVDVLVVDDEQLIRVLMMRSVPRICRGDLVVVSDGDAAMTELDRRSFGLVITDLCMPGPSGIEIAHRVRRDTPDCPVIVMTGRASDDDEAQIAAAGASLLCKPFGLPELRESVDRELSSRRRTPSSR